MGFLNNLRHAWNAFRGIDPLSSNTYQYIIPQNIGQSFYYRPDRVVLRPCNEKSIIASIYSRIANECANIDIKHVRLDDKNRYLEDIEGSDLNKIFSLSANIDQTGRMLIRDLVLTILEEGAGVLVPVDTSDDPNESGSYDILSMRVGKVVKWYPKHVELEVYNDITGNKPRIILPKSEVAIVVNPLHSIMNDPQSTLQRLAHKLALLDAIDEQQGSSKIDLIIQLPYAVRSETRKADAERRRSEVEDQLANSKYGIAYTDGTEKITQLNRPVENNVLKSVEYFTSMLYSQLSMTDEVLKGTADEKAMLNFRSNVIKPIEDAIVDEVKRKFLTATARAQKQSIVYFTNPFSLVPVNNIAEIADKMTRNEIMSPNEIRQVIGLKPVQDMAADELRNRNINMQRSGDVIDYATTNQVSVENSNSENQNNDDSFGDIPIADVMNNNM